MIEYTVNMNAVDFPGSGQYRMVSKWYEMTGSQDFELKDKSGTVKKDLSKVRGAVRTYNSLFPPLTLSCCRCRGHALGTM